jgi:large-conductance mechanosensitive channel
MSKMIIMTIIIENLRNAAAAINEVANWLAEQFSDIVEEASAKEPTTKKEKKIELNLEDIRAILAKKFRAVHTAAIRTLLQKYVTNKLSGIDSKHYESLFMEVSTMEILQTILITLILTIWLVFSVVFLISAIQNYINGRKRKQREADKEKRDLEYHKACMKELRK